MRKDTVVYDSDYQYRIGLKQEKPIVYNKVKNNLIKRGYRKHLNFKETKVVDRKRIN